MLVFISLLGLLMMVSDQQVSFITNQNENTVSSCIFIPFLFLLDILTFVLLGVIAQIEEQKLALLVVAARMLLLWTLSNSMTWFGYASMIVERQRFFEMHNCFLSK